MEGTLAEIRIFAGNFAPRGWAFCQGQLLSIASNQALFSLLGTMYGGDGRTTFALPDLRGRCPIQPGTGPGLSNYRQGSKSGSETETLTTAQIPPHNHVGGGGTQIVEGHLVLSDNLPDSPNAAGRFFTLDGFQLYTTTVTPDLDMAANSIKVSMGNYGGGLAHNNMQPWIAMHYIIAVQGLFPSRN